MIHHSEERTGLLGFLLPGQHPGTTLMQLFCVGFFVLQAIQGQSIMSFNGYALLRNGANIAELSLSGVEPWRLMTYAFLHGGLIHFGFNIYVLSILGKFVESRFGTSRFLILYVISAVIAGIASALSGTGMSVGASGAITGAMGAGIVAAHLHGTRHGIAIRNQLLFWVALNAFIGIGMNSGSGAKVDNMAHLGGLLTGGAIGYLYVFFDKPKKNIRFLESILATMLTVGSVGSMIAHQIYVRNVPVISGTGQEIQIIANQLWDQCSEAIDNNEFEQAISPCSAFRYSVSFNTLSVQLTESLYEETGNLSAARREQKLLLAILKEQSPLFSSFSPRERIIHLRQTIQASDIL